MNPYEAFQKSRIYELLSHAFVEPSNEFLHFVAEGEFLEYMRGATKNLKHTREFRFKVLNDLTESAKNYDIEFIISEYDSLISPQKNYFYECNYYAPSNAIEEMADIAGFYKAFGVVSDWEKEKWDGSIFLRREMEGWEMECDF